MIIDQEKFLFKRVVDTNSSLVNNSSSVYFYITNSDGTIRWIFSSSLKYPTFLNLYNSPTLKALVYKYLLKIIFFLRFQKYFVSGSFKGEIDSKYQNIISSLGCSNYSIFTGTAGENRKIIIELNDGSITKYFIKIPTTNSSYKLVQQESKNLMYLENFNFKYLNIPKVVKRENGIIVVSNIKPISKINKDSNFSEIHFLTLLELYKETSVEKSIEQVSPLNDALKYREKISNENISSEFHKKVSQINSQMAQIEKLIFSKDMQVVVSFAHRDFTPWNMYITSDHIYVYDWELAGNDTPILFDFFHYIFQYYILVKHKNFSEIKVEINRTLNSETGQKIIDKYNIDIDDYFLYYIFINVNYYLYKYLNQDDLHVQVYWLLDVWEQAIVDILENEGKIF